MRRAFPTQNLVLSGLFAALLAVCAQIQLPVPPVPASMSIFAVFLCAALLRPKWAALCVAAYLVLGAIGLPVFAGFRGGPNVMFGVTGGYLLGYLPCAAAASALCRVRPASLARLTLSMLAALPLCYLPGALYMMLLTGIPAQTAFLSGALAFLLGDLLKALLAAVLALRLRRSLRALDLA